MGREVALRLCKRKHSMLIASHSKGPEGVLGWHSLNRDAHSSDASPLMAGAKCNMLGAPAGLGPLRHWGVSRVEVGLEGREEEMGGEEQGGNGGAGKRVSRPQEGGSVTSSGASQS